MWQMLTRASFGRAHHLRVFRRPLNIQLSPHGFEPPLSSMGRPLREKRAGDRMNRSGHCRAPGFVYKRIAEPSVSHALISQESQGRRWAACGDTSLASERDVVISHRFTSFISEERSARRALRAYPSEPFVVLSESVIDGRRAGRRGFALGFL